MGLNMTLTTTQRSTAEVSEEYAETFEEAYETLKELPSNKQLNVDFDDKKKARAFVVQGNAWAAENGLKFARKGDIKANPTRVSFRIYEPRTSGDSAE